MPPNNSAFVGEENLVQHVNDLRICDALDELGYNYDLSEESDRVLYVHFPGYYIKFSLTGPFEAELRAATIFFCELEPHYEPELAIELLRLNQEQVLPRAGYRTLSDGTLDVELHANLDVREGLSHAQLCAHLDRVLRAMCTHADSLGLRYPALFGVATPMLRAAGLRRSDYATPVDLDRVATIVENVASTAPTRLEEHNMLLFPYGGLRCAVFFTHEMNWIVLRASLGVAAGPGQTYELARTANFINAAGTRAHATVEGSGNAQDLILESHINVTEGLTPGQLYSAIQGALNELHRASRAVAEEVKAYPRTEPWSLHSLGTFFPNGCDSTETADDVLREDGEIGDEQMDIFDEFEDD